MLRPARLIHVLQLSIHPKSKPMSIKLGEIAPNFQADTSQGPIDFYQYLGDSWGVLFSHPADFTPVCTTELGQVAKLKKEFDKRNVKVLALSVDPLDAHERWIKDINETQNTLVNFPLIADSVRKVSLQYDMINPEATEKDHSKKCIHYRTG